MTINTRHREWLSVMQWMVIMFLTVIPGMTMADLSLNFLPMPINQRIPNITNLDCRSPELGGCVRGNTLSDPDKTPFYQELVLDKGISYYHVIVGDPKSEFAQEYYINVTTRAGGGVDCCWSNGAPFSDSSGTFNGGTDITPFQGWADPLGPTVGFGGSGSGTGNPERIIFRQIVQNNELTQETSKLTFLNKPTINQALISPQIEALFNFDMSNSTYHDMTTTGVMTNSIKLFDGLQPTTFLDFNVVSNRQSSKLTGGMYTFAPGIDKGGSNGTYQYQEGDFDPRPIDYRLFSNSTNIPN